MAGDNYRFAESDSLLCYHGPMLYEAKCLKRRKTSDGKAQYFIHYKGWNSKWEEWVDDDRVLTVNTANMNKMASLKEIHSNSKKSGAKRSITTIKEETTRNVTPPIKGRKRKHSEISSESSQVVNVSSPAEPKPKKRGRPPKNTSTKIESNEVMETSDTVAVTDTVEPTKLIEVPKVTRSLGANKTIAANKVVEIKKVVETTKADKEAKVISATNGVELNKEVEKTELIELNKSTEVTKDIRITEVVELAESIEGTKDVDMSEAFEMSKSIEASNEVINTKAFVSFSETEVIEDVGATDIVVTDGATKTLEVVEALEANSAVNDASETESVIETVQSFEEKEVPETIEEIKKAKTSCEPLKSLWILDVNDTVESIKEIETETTKSNEEIEDTETREIIEEFEGFEDIKEKKLIEESLERTEIDLDTELSDKTERVIFTVPAPVEKTLPIIRIPEILRRKIAHDFYMTVKLNKILKFPKKYTVEKLIRAYICSKSKADIQDYNLKYSIRHRSFNLGVTLMQYFNILIHCQLLYLKEKEYGLFKKAKVCLKKKFDADLIHHCLGKLMYPNEFWHYVYSPTYLLRLFVFMPRLLMSSVFTNQELAYFALSCEDFLKFLESKHELYFTDDDYK